MTDPETTEWLRDNNGVYALQNVRGQPENRWCAVVYPGYGVSYDEAECVARLMQKTPRLIEACRSVEKWWVEQGQYVMKGAPACIFNLRQLLDEIGESDCS